MNFSQKMMGITKCKNGWILEFPGTSEQEQITSMYGGIAKGIIRGATDQMLGEPDAHSELMNTFPSPLGLVDTNIYIFTEFREMMAFIDLTFKNNE